MESARTILVPGVFVQILVYCAFAVSPMMTTRLEPNAYSGGLSKDESETARRNNSAIGAILGEVRTNMSDLMFMKTERYLHNGVAYAPHIDMEELANTGEIQPRAEDHGRHEGEHDENHDTHAAEPLQTMIRTKAEDFRGFIGYLERQVKPWHDPSEGDHHTDGTELLPWYRLMTLTDPHNVRAYLIGAWWLKTKGPAEAREALRFVDEGIRANANSYQLHLMRGYLLHRDLSDSPAALEAFRKAAALALDARPHDYTEPTLVWNDYHEEDALGAVRMAVLLEKEIGDPSRALAMAREFDARLGGDAILKRQIESLSHAREADPQESSGRHHQDE